MIKIIFSDIDGTFLKDDKTVSELHAKALRLVVARGIKFVFVSARMPEAIYPITDALGIGHTAVISYGGGLVLTETEEVIFDKRIGAADTAGILAATKRWADISVNFYSGRRWFVEAIDRRVEFEMAITGASAEVVRFEDLQREGILPNKILIMSVPTTCREMEITLGNEFSGLNVVRSAPHLLEVMDRSISKAVGIGVLLERYGIGIDEAIAFGDNYNDVEMLRMIPRSVAMGNAPTAVQAIAGAVTDSNEFGGIYTYLERCGVFGGS